MKIRQVYHMPQIVMAAIFFVIFQFSPYFYRHWGAVYRIPTDIDL